jgi:hypothetical protein
VVVLLVELESPERPVPVVVVVGVAVPMVVEAMFARKTTSPFVSPEVISVSCVPLAPILTVVVTELPFFSTSTV